MVPIKSESHQQKTIPAGTFKDSHLHGQMVPSIWCKEHDVSRKKIVHLTDRDVDDKVSHYSHRRNAFTATIERIIDLIGILT